MPINSQVLFSVTLSQTSSANDGLCLLSQIEPHSLGVVPQPHHTDRPAALATLPPTRYPPPPPPAHTCKWCTVNAQQGECYLRLPGMHTHSRAIPSRHTPAHALMASLKTAPPSAPTCHAATTPQEGCTCTPFATLPIRPRAPGPFPPPTPARNLKASL